MFESPEEKTMPFSLFISAQRRKHIINSMMSKGEEKKSGERVMKNYKKSLEERFER